MSTATERMNKTQDDAKANLLRMIAHHAERIGNDASFDITAFSQSKTHTECEDSAKGNRLGYEDALDDATAEILHHSFTTVTPYTDDSDALYALVHMMIDRLARAEY